MLLAERRVSEGRTSTSRRDIEDEIYASSDLETSIPKYKAPDQRTGPRHVCAVIHDELMLDGNSPQNLATFCQTWSEPEVHCFMNACIAKNIEDKDEIKAGPKWKDEIESTLAADGCS